ncbi:uncharacterized protein LOC133285060 [Gastrolobium bilobum]|uniref:uncharacterized protein LOC133285060 n=1 Tax=Gastrolobium bilobum TaxID=150636 RepID=UPI002AB1F846|nr:uncharacterized protein LOC133285060 [Gastrolobium bilobum]
MTTLDLLIIFRELSLSFDIWQGSLGDSAMVSDGVTLLSLLTHWTFIPPIINSSWNASDSIPCSWVGVQCDHDHHVVSLNLTDHAIFGELGPQIGKLYHLQTLVLLGNGFSGKVPSELSNCSLLEYLDLSENSFSGKIPYSLKKLQNLRHISLSSNLLTGEIPDSLFQIPPLDEVSLHSNLLSGPIPTNIGNATELSRLYLYGNQLSGTIPSSIGNCSKLEDLDLSFNHLTGEIPASIWRIPSLKHILVHNNSLFGELPLEMTKLKHLKNISLFDNQFSGVIPQSLGINSSLVKLDCKNNKFTGSIPPNLCFGKKLCLLDMESNQLQGGILSDIGRCGTLRRLILKENNFTGPLPDFVSNPNLTYMDISKNNISGSIPSSLENCTDLTEINLSMNKFTGLIPSDIGKLVNLVNLDLAHNKLEGPLPPELSSCTKMDRFDVGFNSLNGSFPCSFTNWTGITTLILSGNHFTRGIPDCLAEFGNLRELQLGGNLFGGQIPRSCWMGNLRSLFYGLNLSANGLTGDIPSEISNLGVQSLDVSLNNLTGSIDVLEGLAPFIEVNISYNFFDGPVPEHLMKLLNSSPSSFMGNPLLCVNCSLSDGLGCNKNSYVKPCVYKSTDHRGISCHEIVMIALGSSIFIFAVLLIVIVMYLQRRSQQEMKRASSSHNSEQELKYFAGNGGGKIGAIFDSQVHISAQKKPSYLNDLVLKATENLNDRYIIGRGGHSIVYKAQLGELDFAVKKVTFGSNKQKYVGIMQKEIQTLGMIKHRNLVAYADYWVGEDYGLIIYEFMENGSLHDILHEKNPPPSLTWDVRFKIAVGIAQGLAYLHHDCNPPIVHRDIKPKNILLDANMEPLIADFGTALYRNLYEHSNSHSGSRPTLSLRIAGTPGYIAPENAYAIVQSRKSDVYSYGVVLLELITRKKAYFSSLNDKEEVTTIVNWARSVWLETGKIEKIADSYLASAFPNSAVLAKQVTAVLLLALQCTEKDADNRTTMKDVINFYQKGVFKLWCGDVVYVDGDEAESFPDVPVVSIDHHLHRESSRAANLRKREVTFNVETEPEDLNDRALTRTRSTTITLVLLVLSFPAFLHGDSEMVSDGLTLWSLLACWTSIPPIINSSWNASDSTPCSWVGVQCDHDHHVVSLNLPHHGIFGDLGPQIGKLYHLQTLVLSGNGFSGKVPSELSNCSLLKYLDLSENSFSGQIPLEITKLKNLKNISLFDNQFSGVIPQSLGINSSLVKLDCKNNKFTGSIPPNLCFGKQLRVLDIGSNQLQGGIPSDVGRCATLRRLILKENNFTGPLPDFVSNPNLSHMGISKNNISGSIPSSLENCTNLTEINLSMNKLTGLIPSEIGKLVNLVTLDLAHNKLEGPLPPELSNCTKMDRFDVGFNSLNGSFPSSFSSWTGITTLILSGNHFTGGIPGCLPQFNNLRNLQLGGNLFGGKIPRSMAKLRKLFYGLNLSDNGLTGDIPSEISNLEALQSMDVSLNNLTGGIDVLEGLVSLIEVNISYNFFDGPVPEHLMKLLNSSPSSFMGNPLLCVNCPLSDGLGCNETSYVKPRVYKSTDHRGISRHEIVMIALGSSIFISVMLLIVIVMYLQRRSKQAMKIDSQVHISAQMNPSYLEDLVLKATENLNDRYIIGRGGHGIVYKAQLGQLDFAVKKVTFGSNKQKYLSILQREIQTLEKIKHRNLVAYADYWVGEDYGLIIYEFMENGSLHDILHEKKPPPSLTWDVRFKIAVGIARGLAYLHHDCNPPIVHRDIKPKNILLDANMEPLIADFGTALYRNLHESSNSHAGLRPMLSSQVAGTPGYIAPENAYAIVQSRKSDVYSYGVVLLELITRKKVLVPSLNDKEEVTTLVNWARSVRMKTGKIVMIADSYLASAFPNSALVAKQVTAVLLLALQCTERDARYRPTMEDVIKFYQNGLFKLRCSDVVYGAEIAAVVAPQQYNSPNLFPDVPVVSIDHNLHGEITFNVETEPEDFDDFSFLRDANQSQLGVYARGDWKLVYRPITGTDGLVIKLMGNGKIQAEQVAVVALIVPKISYTWPFLIFLPSVIGPVLTKPFNWFFLSRWAQYLHLQKSLYSQPITYFIIPLKATLQLSNHGDFESPYIANVLQSLNKEKYMACTLNFYF